MLITKAAGVMHRWIKHLDLRAVVVELLPNVVGHTGERAGDHPHVVVQLIIYAGKLKRLLLGS